MNITITSPIAPPGVLAQVTRPVTVTGIADTSNRDTGPLAGAYVGVQLGGGTPFFVGIGANGVFTATVQPPANLRGTDTFQIVATLNATYFVGSGDPDMLSFSAEARITVQLADVVPPQLAITPAPPASGVLDVTATQLPHSFTVTGTASDADSNITVLQCALDVDAPIPLLATAGSFSKTFALTAGLHRLVFQAADAGGHATSQELFVNVHPPTEPPDPHSESITSWTRLEPQTRDGDLGMSVAARAFDPVWLLTRQWQVGEFQGMDAGSPVQARARATTARLSRVRLGPAAPDAQTVRYDPTTMPLEALVERRRMRPVDANDLRQLTLAVEAGQHFLRMLEAQAFTKYRTGFLTRYAIQLPPAATLDAADEATRRFLGTTAGRALDARRLVAAIRPPTSGAPPTLDPVLQIPPADLLKVQQTAAGWHAWYDTLFSEPVGASEAWDASRMEYGVTTSAAFSAQAGDQVSVTAVEYADGRLDWSSFDVDAAADLGSGADGTFASIVETTIPAPVSFRGAPAVRFWEVEDSEVAYGLVPVGPTDLAHMLLIEYAGSYGNDWFTVPLRVAVGSITRVDSLVVTDTFGVRTLVRPIDTGPDVASRFAMWQQSARRLPGATSLPLVVPNVFLFPSGIGKTVDGAALEEVLLMRDEMANVAWGIERTIESPLEQPLAGAALTSSAPTVASPSGLPTSSPGAPRYVLASTVPDHWIPLLPVRLANAAGPEMLRLQRGAVLQLDGTSKPHGARGELLGTAGPLLLYDAEVPREGVRVTRARRMARWIDGSTWVWNAFRKSVGRGEGSSGLQFDRLDEPGG